MFIAPEDHCLHLKTKEAGTYTFNFDEKLCDVERLCIYDKTNWEYYYGEDCLGLELELDSYHEIYIGYGDYYDEAGNIYFTISYEAPVEE